MALTISDLALDPSSEVPIYRQIAQALAAGIESGAIRVGERLPATRELAGQLGLNRTTISAAYSVLEETGLLSGHVGRGSFVASKSGASIARNVNSRPSFNFASSRPAADAFPLASFRKLAKTVIDSPEAADILQLGSSQGYRPLRQYLLDNDRRMGLAGLGDDVIVTNGCQQALDLIARSYSSRQPESEPLAVLVEDPVYHGLLKVFRRVGAKLIPVPVGEDGMDVNAAEACMEVHRPRLVIVTPDFQNPTGWTLSLTNRERLLQLSQRYGVTIVENGIYSELRYIGQPIPSIKQLDESGQTILLRSYSKVAFPGLRVGWATAARDTIWRLSEEKQISDLHSDQLAQAIFLQFAQSGELDNHIARTCTAGRKRLQSVFHACRHWPAETIWTRPEGGMSLWVELPSPLTAEMLLCRASREGVEFLPGSNFSVNGASERGLRLSFGGLAPDAIERGIALLGAAASAELRGSETNFLSEPTVALV